MLSEHKWTELKLQQTNEKLQHSLTKEREARVASESHNSSLVLEHQSLLDKIATNTFMDATNNTPTNHTQSLSNQTNTQQANTNTSLSQQTTNSMESISNTPRVISQETFLPPSTQVNPTACIQQNTTPLNSTPSFSQTPTISQIPTNLTPQIQHTYNSAFTSLHQQLPLQQSLGSNYSYTNSFMQPVKHEKIKVAEPPKFTGSYSEDAKQWLEDLEFYNECQNHVSDRSAALSLKARLDEYALSWCNQLPSETQRSFPLLKQEFISEFVLNADPFGNLVDLRNIKFRTMQDFDNFVKLHRKHCVQQKLNTQEQKINSFYSHLPPSISQLVKMNRPKSLAEVIIRARHAFSHSLYDKGDLLLNGIGHSKGEQKPYSGSGYHKRTEEQRQAIQKAANLDYLNN